MEADWLLALDDCILHFLILKSYFASDAASSQTMSEAQQSYR